MCIDRGVPRVIMPRNAAGCDAPRCASTTTGENVMHSPRHSHRSGHRLSPPSPHQHSNTADHHGQRTQQLLQPEEEERLRAAPPRDRARGRRRPPPVPRKSVLYPLYSQLCSSTDVSLCPDRSTTNFFAGSPLAALTTLSFSENVDLQRSAALAFAEITEKEVREVGRDTLDPVLYLLSSHDPEVQRAASAALGNLAVNGER